MYYHLMQKKETNEGTNCLATALQLYFLNFYILQRLLRFFAIILQFFSQSFSSAAIDLSLDFYLRNFSEVRPVMQSAMFNEN